MTQLVIVFHPAASDEVEAAHEWYAARSPIAAARLLEELDRAAADIQASPECGRRTYTELAAT